MTNREMYVFGWVFGRINAECAPDDSVGGDIALACARPFSGNAKVISQALHKGILQAVEDEIGKALCEIEQIEPPMVNGSEQYQPLELQGSWQFGYFCGKCKNPLPPAKIDIGLLRKAKDLTQAQLAELMGVDRALVSRWEQGKVVPNEKNQELLKKILL